MKKNNWIFVIALMFIGNGTLHAYYGDETSIDGAKDVQARKNAVLFYERSSDPGSPSTNGLRLYAKDNSGATTLYTKDSDGTVVELGASGISGHTIQDEGGAGLTARTNLNFTGAGVTCADDSGNDATKCTITSGGGSGTMTTVKENDVGVGGADIVTIDFLGADFNLTETPDTEIQIVIEDSGIDHDATTNFAANEHLDWTGDLGATNIHTGNYPITDSEVPDTITIDLATLATTLTITDNESTAETNALIFTAGGALTGGNLGLESDGDLTYTPSTGTLAATLITQGGQTMYDANDVPGGELGGTWSSPTVDDSITVTGWAMGASTATTPAADDSDTSLATSAYVQGEINGAGGTDLSCSSGQCNVDDSFLKLGGDVASAGTYDFGSASVVLEIPNAAAPTTDATGEMAIDTNLITQGMLQVYLASAIANVVATTDTPGDNEIPKYDSAGGTIQWEADAGGGGTAFNEISLPIQSAKITGSFVTDADATQGAGIDAGDGNWRLLFEADSGVADEAAVWQFKMPNNYSSAPILEIIYSMTSATTLEVEFEGAIMCVSDGDSADVGTASFSAIAVGSATVPGTVGYPDKINITLTDDSCAADDVVWVYLSTDADDATLDDATGDREVIAVTLSYTAA